MLPFSTQSLTTSLKQVRRPTHTASIHIYHINLTTHLSEGGPPAEQHPDHPLEVSGRMDLKHGTVELLLSIRENVEITAHPLSNSHNSSDYNPNPNPSPSLTYTLTCTHVAPASPTEPSRPRPTWHCAPSTPPGPPEPPSEALPRLAPSRSATPPLCNTLIDSSTCRAMKQIEVEGIGVKCDEASGVQ